MRKLFILFSCILCANSTFADTNFSVSYTAFANQKWFVYVSAVPPKILYADSSNEETIRFSLPDSVVANGLGMISIKRKIIFNDSVKTLQVGFPVQLEKGNYSFSIEKIDTNGVHFTSFNAPERTVLTNNLSHNLKALSLKKENVDVIMDTLLNFTQKHPEITYPYFVMYQFIPTLESSKADSFLKKAEPIIYNARKYAQNGYIANQFDSTFYKTGINTFDYSNLKLSTPSGIQSKVIDRNKITIMHFWASWCVPCLHEMPEIIAWYKDLDKAKYYFISVSLDTDKEKWTEALKKYADDWGQQFDDDQTQFSKKVGVYSVPSFIVYNPQTNKAQKLQNLKDLKTLTAQ